MSISTPAILNLLLSFLLRHPISLLILKSQKRVQHNMSTASKQHCTQRDPQAGEVFPVYCFLEDLTNLVV